MTITTTRTRTKNCDRCGATGLTWKQSTRTGRWYLSEPCLRRGYTGKQFRSQRPHQCVGLSTEPVAPVLPLTVYGTQHTVIEDPATHEHRWMPWRKTPGGITGAYCFGCAGLLVD